MNDARAASSTSDSALERRLDRLGLSGHEDDWTDRYLLCEHLLDPAAARPRQRFEAVARFCRDLIAHRWVKTRETRERAHPKRIFYLSMEFLIGRSLFNNVMNMAIDPLVQRAIRHQGWDLAEILDEEPDAGLGNGGLGRLASCFIESLASQQYSAMGYGLRYEYGIFRQVIHGGRQIEVPDNWLRRPDPWEIVRPGKVYHVPLGASFELRGGAIELRPGRPSTLIAIPYDRPVVGYGAQCVNTLRLWQAAAPDHFNLAEFSQGDFAGAVIDHVAAESLTRVLYPDDSTDAGRTLRFLQQYFLVSCTLQDILARFRRRDSRWSDLPDHVAIQMNDTHPSLAVAELMRILLDEARLGWDEAWSITTRTLGYTNHTLLPEALERWPVHLFEQIIPRQLEIIYEINHRFLEDVERRFPGDAERVPRMSLIQEEPVRAVRMAHLAVVGSHSTNGVSRIHTDLLRTHVMPEFAQMYPERFSNKTNGITPRRWLMWCNPSLSNTIDTWIGAGWRADFEQLAQIAPLADDGAAREQFMRARRAAKLAFVDWLRDARGIAVDPDTIFDSQVKRIHEYKRQLLNVLHLVLVYNRLRRDPDLAMPPRTVFFAGKAAPAYHFAKLVIRLINEVSMRIEEEPAVRSRLRVLFLPDYNVSLAERLIPASDISEQISTAGYEASGTGNMKFMMNGALTVGTRDGATIEMAAAAGDENFFLFGLSARQVAETRASYDPHWLYEHDVEIRDAIDLIASGHFCPDDPSAFAPIRDRLLAEGDYYMHLADLRSYEEAQARAGTAYGDSGRWAAMAIRNVAASTRFSSDRAIREYASEIWKAEPCPVP
jgi:starch phosphorylase